MGWRKVVSSAKRERPTLSSRSTLRHTISITRMPAAALVAVRSKHSKCRMHGRRRMVAAPMPMASIFPAISRPTPRLRSARVLPTTWKWSAIRTGIASPCRRATRSTFRFSVPAPHPSAILTSASTMPMASLLPRTTMADRGSIPTCVTSPAPVAPSTSKSIPTPTTRSGNIRSRCRRPSRCPSIATVKLPIS